MDKFTETRQKLGRQLYAIIKKYNDNVHGHLDINGMIHFYAKNSGADATYCVEMGFKFSDNDDGLFAIRKFFNRVEDAVSMRTKVENLEECLRFMPVVEKFCEISNWAADDTVTPEETDDGPDDETVEG